MPIDDDLRAAIEASNLRSVPAEVIERLADDALRRRFPSASPIHREETTSPHLEIVISGLVRVYVTAGDGRTMTVRYCRPGDVIGTVSLFAATFSLPAAIQAVTEAELLSFRPSSVQAAAERDPRIARALLTELSERVLALVAEIRDSAFATVRQRVARHLLDLASQSQSGAALVARIGQQDLADAVGSVREVVVRALRELREAGVIETGREGIAVVDPDRLLGEAYARSPDSGQSAAGT